MKRQDANNLFPTGTRRVHCKTNGILLFILQASQHAQPLQNYCCPDKERHASHDCGPEYTENKRRCLEIISNTKEITSAHHFSNGNCQLMREL